MNNIYVQQIIDLKNKGIYFKNYRWVMHVIYWGYVLFSNITIPIGFTKNFIVIIFGNILANLGVFIFYLLYCILFVPKFYKKNKYKKFILSFIFSITILGLLDYIVFNPISDYILNNPKTIDNTGFIKTFLTSILLGYVSNFFIISFLLYFCEAMDSISTESEIQESIATTYQANRKIETHQLSSNHITSRLDAIELLLQQDTKDSTQAILHYSQVLRYELYATLQSNVSIDDELQYITDYCLLQNNLFNKKFIVETQLINSKNTIKPLALFTIIICILDIENNNKPTTAIFVIDDAEVNCLFEFEEITENIQQQLASKIGTLHQQTTDIIIAQDNVSATQTNINICIPLPLLIA